VWSVGEGRVEARMAEGSPGRGMPPEPGCPRSIM
jgi:hypothetical protein